MMPARSRSDLGPATSKTTDTLFMGTKGAANMEGVQTMPPPVSDAANAAKGNAARGPKKAQTTSALFLEEPEMKLRIRFYNFNMGNNTNYRDLSSLWSSPGTGFEELLRWPAPDGAPVDLVFASLVETRVALSDWKQAFLKKKKKGEQPHLDSMVHTNARAEGSESGGTGSIFSSFGIRKMVEGMVADYNGNLKTLVAYARKRLEPGKEQLFGRLPEAKVGGVAVPNPKKAFTGSVVRATDGSETFRLCLVGAHFPIDRIRAALEDPENRDPLHTAKVALAKSLRKVLRRACFRGMIDMNSFLIIQGDLNSRTFLHKDKDGKLVVFDALLEIMKDEDMQAAIQMDLPCPSGKWIDLCHAEESGDLPVTYKFNEPVGKSFVDEADLFVDRDGTSSRSSALSLRGGFRQTRPLTLREVVEAAGTVPDGDPADDVYKRTLSAVGKGKLAGWGVDFKASSWKPFRFPACADRVVVWAPLGLAARSTWELPRGGYQVCHWQHGSDHRPVILEATLKIGPPVLGGASQSFSAPDDSVHRASLLEVPTHSETAHEVCQSDDEDSENDVELVTQNSKPSL